MPTITIDYDKKCVKCGKPGATTNGLCIKCTIEKINERIKEDADNH